MAGAVTDLRFTLLGTGTSSGIPVIACDCATCTSDDPRDRRTRVGAVLEFTDPEGQPRTVLLDCPPDHREHALRHRIRRVDAILFTHAHVDHVFGLDDARLYNVSMRAPVHLYAERTVLDDLERIYDHIFRPHRNVNKSFVADVVTHAVLPGEPIALFGVQATPVRLLHGALPIVGWRFDAPGARAASAGGSAGPIAYCTDVNGIPPETWPRLAGLDTLVLDMLRERAHPTHFSLQDALGVAGRLRARRTVLTHMTHDVRHAELSARLPAGVELGYDGMRL
ncbi:MAG: MBL fold metallo-hydrolase [Planctomycetes bacterium]|nr:MBL fold metallo-hydrolase [Planctomycetota bacterium]